MSGIEYVLWIDNLRPPDNSGSNCLNICELTLKSSLPFLTFPGPCGSKCKMCGIAGVIGDFDSERSRTIVQIMMTSLRRRGPDGEGLEQWPGATLGHRRRSIFDLSSAGRQPMVSKDGQVGLVFNGAIYNFGELRTELEGDGVEFRSRTDTEGLLHRFV